MSKLVKTLSNSSIQSLKPADKEYTKSNNNGLYIRIFPNGAKKFYFAYKFLNKHRKTSLGNYPDLSLAKAREMAQEFRSLLAQGLDPQAQRQANIAKPQSISLLEMAKLWRKWYTPSVLEKTLICEWRRLEYDFFPLFGNRSICSLNFTEIMEALRLFMK